jgi:hypothetical protein
MITRNFKAFVGGNEKEFVVRSPSLGDQKEATKIYNQSFSEALKAGAVVRAKLDDLLVDQGLWDDKKQQQFMELQSTILEGEKTLAKGGISLSNGKTVALEMKKNRDKLRNLISVKTELDTHTAEGQADNARFNYFVSACTVYKDTNERYFSNYEDYINRSTDVVAILAAQNLAGLLYGLDSDYEEKLPENKFLVDYKFVDDKLRLINKDGKLVDENGKLIDENGRFIDEKGQFVDKNGNPVDSEGDYIVEFKPFTDDNGNPVIMYKEVVSDEPTTPISQSEEEPS